MSETSYSASNQYYHSSRARSINRGALLVFMVFLGCFGVVYLLAAFNLIVFSTTLTIGLMLALIAYFLTMQDIRIGLAIMILAIALSPELAIGSIKNLRLEDFLVPAIFFAWMTKHIRTRFKFSQTDLKMPILLMIMLMIVSTIISSVGSDAFSSSNLLVLGKMLEYYLIFFIVLNTLKTRRELRTFIALMLICSALAGLYSTFVYYNNPEIVNMLTVRRLSGPGGETSNILGGYFIFHMLLAVGLLFHAGTRKYRYWLWLYIGMMLYPLILTMSRTSYVAFFGGMLLLGLLKNKRILIFGLLLFIVIPFVVDSETLFRIKTIPQVLSGENLPSSWKARVEGWQEFLKFVPQSPLIGFGAGSTPRTIDNEYIRLLGDVGILGLLIFLWMIYRIFKASYVAAREVKDPVLGGYALGFLGGLLALLIHSIGATTFTTIRTMEPFFFGTGILYVIYNRFTFIKPALESAAADEGRFKYDENEMFVFIEDGLPEWAETTSETEKQDTEQFYIVDDDENWLVNEDNGK
jgi:O-antigen ligase